MAGLSKKELLIILEEQGLGSYIKKMGIANAEQDKLEKGTAAMGKNSTANFAKMSQGLGGLVHVYATVNTIAA